MVQGIERREKCYVEIDAHFDLEGIPWPQAIVWEDGRRFAIDRVIDRRHAASMKVGGFGIRYTVAIEGQQKFLWQDNEGWYVERIIHDGVCSLG